MERRFVYSLVRCVPDPRTGEFINYGAIVGDPDTGEWSTRHVSNTSRVRRLAEDEEPLNAVQSLFTRIEYEIDRSRQLFDDEGAAPAPLDEVWLHQLHHDHRSLVQLTPPIPMIAATAEQALDVIFAHLVIDPLAQARSLGITRQGVAARIRRSYVNAHIGLWSEHPIIHVGEHIRASIDFAVGNGRIVQLSQGWSFQLAGMPEVSNQIKAWAYTINRVRDGQVAYVQRDDGHRSSIARDVDVEVVVAQPLNSQQRDAFEEAGQVFADVGAKVSGFDDVDAVGRRAAELLAEH